VLAASFDAKFRLNKERVIKNVYQRASRKVGLASFAPFMCEHIDHPYIDGLLRDGSREFVMTNIKPLPDYRDYVSHFVGSIAFYFRNQLRQVCDQYGVKAGKILQRPIEELFKYVVERERYYEIQPNV